MNRSLARRTLAPTLAFGISACVSAPEPPAECASAWSAASATGLVDAIAKATVRGPPVWGQYGLEDGSYVLYAGESVEGGSCFGVWNGGEAKAYGVLAAKPKLLTPLYGYHFLWEGNGGPFDPLVGAAAQPPEISTWFAELGVASAVIIPVSVEGLPFEISQLQQVQIALHEAFHVEVQVPRWLGPTGYWPVWDLQPDRPAINACYSGDASVESALENERNALDRLVTALLAGDTANACVAGPQFLNRRAARYELLGDVSVAGHDRTPGSCAVAEAIMELEEGTADFASWSMLFDLGQASRDALMGRYRAEQNDVFYLTGAMQLHALSLMNPEEFIRVTEEIAVSQTPLEGSLTAVLARGIESYCR